MLAFELRGGARRRARAACFVRRGSRIAWVPPEPLRDELPTVLDVTDELAEEPGRGRPALAARPKRVRRADPVRDGFRCAQATEATRSGLC